MSQEFQEESESASNYSGDVYEYQEVSAVSWSDRLLTSLLGCFLGVLLFFGSFAVLFFNETSTDFSQVARAAIVLSPEISQPQAQEQTVSLTGAIEVPEAVGDNLYLKPGAYAILARTVEMYAWREEVSTETQTHLGGAQTQVKTYRYSKEWTDSPQASNAFQHPEHQNPQPAIDNQVFLAPAARIGRYQIDMANLTRVLNYPSSCLADSRTYERQNASGVTLPNNSQLTLKPNMLLPTQAKPVGNYLFQGFGTPQSPQVGDLRICYSALPANSTVTLFGKLQNDKIGPATVGRSAFLRLFPGNREPAIAALKTEYQTWLWVFRLAGFVMMWLGLWLLVNPISVVLSWIPLLGDLSNALNSITSFVGAFAISAVTILVLSLGRHPLVLAGSVAVTVLVLVLGQKVLRAVCA